MMDSWMWIALGAAVAALLAWGVRSKVSAKRARVRREERRERNKVRNAEWDRAVRDQKEGPNS